MKRQLLVPTFAFLASIQSLLAQSAGTNFPVAFRELFYNHPALELLVAKQIPRARLFESCSGTFFSLADRTGDQVRINLHKPDSPQPVTNAIGYWDSLVMNFLRRQKMKADTESNVVAAVQLYLSLAHGTDFIRANPCRARRFADCWVVAVDHDFKNYPGNIMAITPFELQVNADSAVVQFRERCFDYLGSAKVYTNTLTTVYQREVKIQGGRNYPEAVDSALAAAWKTER